MDEAPRPAWWRRHAHFVGFETLKYEPLDIEKEEIRLITLLPGEAGIVKCRLENISLDANPTYQALSYCWGNANQTKRIIVNECAVNVTVSLESATPEPTSGSMPSVLINGIFTSETGKFFV